MTRTRTIKEELYVRIWIPRVCGCGNVFRTTQYYYADDEEGVDEYGDE